MSKTAILIPAYKPEKELLILINQLIAAGFSVVVVDDGGGKEYSDIFIPMKKMGCIVLNHLENKGKGKALKTGIKYLIENNYSGAVTVDADGQQLCSDILRIVKELEEHPNYLILGIRNFDKLPIKMKLGNKLTRGLLSLIYRKKVKDTQTGLRGIPLVMKATNLLNLEGDRFDYEMNMLIYSDKLFEGLYEIEIEKSNNNKTIPHSRSIIDLLRIYSSLFMHFPKFILSSLLAFSVDYSLFTLLFYYFGMETITSNLIARVISSTINYYVNKRMVFKYSGKHYTILKYYSLVVIIFVLNSGLIFFLVNILHIPAFIGKILVEISLFVISFIIQRKLTYQLPSSQTHWY